MDAADRPLEIWIPDRPLLIRQGSIEVPGDSSSWQNGAAWIEGLSRPSHDELCGVILPLELTNSGKKFQESYGVELLDWLRWSAEGEIRFLPVLAVAWQSLNNILRATQNLLLVSPGTFFARLPQPMDHQRQLLRNFVRAVRDREPTMKASTNSIERFANALRELSTLTHHDLANDLYAADRLWRGYCRALERANEIRGDRNLSLEMIRTKTVRFDWQSALVKRMSEPSFRKFLVSHRHHGYPQYPAIQRANEIVQRHVLGGLPSSARVLLVDDEFDRGLADVLLQILFRQSDFTFKNGDEWVFAEGEKYGDRLYSSRIPPPGSSEMR